MGFVHGRNMTLVTDSAFLSNTNSQSFVVNEYITRKGIRNVSFNATDDNCFYDEKTGLYCMKNAFFFNNNKIFVVDKHPEGQSETSIECDCLIVRNGYYGTPEDYLAPFQGAAAVIIDGSNSRKMQQQWHTVQNSLVSPVYFLQEQGAFQLMIND
jgi:hypothetical protein